MKDDTATDMKVEESNIDGLSVIYLRQVADGRGVIRELFRESALEKAGLSGFGVWRQVNITETKFGVVRGLHGEDMWKLVSLASGSGLGVYVDLRVGSKTRGNLFTVLLKPGVQVLIPNGVCNGFQSTSIEPSQYVYCFDREWKSGMKGYSITPLDPELHVRWPVEIVPSNRNQISQKDVEAPLLREALAGP
ncbi:dTDP-4-dehydrorhamnose 3,5-epimerase family protein [Gordonia rubripertincta]|uniref:dTDP-4-dehydrorhamnose 3,5-epimerase n=1 Tax=Gordonia rubripertincta TaxID=36822 RepID=A0ABT4MXT4_GORRU|nr:dTDP-4-dehydrorhamnose 3,5-epimerase [Gordonia rubripertincta]MCZ4551807.1 dTDP-4-dehydrorhamnose 3,5-epimerase [Gordonia rubripertincta]